MANDVSYLLQSAVAHHTAGRLADAEKIYRQILATNPLQPDALHLLGMIAGQTGNPQIAVDLIARAIAVAPNVPLFHQSMAESQRRLGRREDAIASIRQAMTLDGNSPTSLARLAELLQEAGRFEEALAANKEIIRKNPSVTTAHINASACLLKLSRPADAVEFARRAIELDPNSASAQLNLGSCLQKLSDQPGAISAFRRALELKPDLAEAHSNFGVALIAMGDFSAALQAHRQALALNPHSSEIHHNYADALLATRDVPGAIAGLRGAIALAPADAKIHRDLGMALLMSGEFAEGWTEYEWRLRVDDSPSLPFKSNVARWQGQDPQGKTILVHFEQGFGDAIQFSRYIPLLAARGANVLLFCPENLRRLFATLPGNCTLVKQPPFPPFDFHCPMLSLAKYFGSDLNSIPREAPYLQANPELAADWKNRVAPPAASLRVGLVWAGRATHENDKNRSISLDQLAPLAAIKGIFFYSLQKRPTGSPPPTPPPNMTLFDFNDRLIDFADTAALIENLDLVISVDSAVAHLAGALGKPTWVLIPYVPDWRWLLDRTDSPWYPTIRLYRQQAPKDWSAPLQAMAQDLAARNI